MIGSARDLTRWKKTEISTLFRKARTVERNPVFDIRVAPTASTYGRLLVVIPKKVGSAPYRNLLRRQVKSLFYEHKLFTLGFDWIIFIKTHQNQPSYQDFLKILTATASRLQNGSS